MAPLRDSSSRYRFFRTGGRGARALPLLTFSLLLLGACASEPESPEKQVRTLVTRAETAAEERSLGALKEMISEDYTDRRGHDRQAVTGLLRYHFLRNEEIHLFTRVGAIEFPSPERARVAVFAAMAGTPIPSPTEIDPLRASLHRFDLLLVDEGKGEWRLAAADWRRAKPGDFF